MSLFLKNKKQPKAVEELLTELRVMLDKRQKRPAKRRKRSEKTNVIDFMAHAASRPEDITFLEEYQGLARAVLHYFFKKEGELTYEDYHYLKQQITELQEIVKHKQKEK